MLDLSKPEYLTKEKIWRASYGNTEIYFAGTEFAPNSVQVEYTNGVLIYFSVLLEQAKQYLAYFVDFERIKISDPEWLVADIDFRDSLNQNMRTFSFHLYNKDDIYGNWFVRFNHWVKQQGEFNPFEFSRVTC